MLIRSAGPEAKGNPFRFSSKYSDDATELLYYGYRVLSAANGRWLSRDPGDERAGVNLFALVKNDSEDKVDVIGLEDFPYQDPDGVNAGGRMPDDSVGTISISLYGNQLCRASLDGQVILSLAIRTKWASDDVGRVLALVPVFFVDGSATTLPDSTMKDKYGAVTSSGTLVLGTSRCPSGLQRTSGIITIQDFTRGINPSIRPGPSNPGITTMSFTYQYSYECTSKVICGCYAKSPFRYTVAQTGNVVNYPGLPK